MDGVWLLRLDNEGDGPRLAVKDCIDVAGTVTTAGSRAVAEGAAPARVDAVCVATAREQGARIVGKTNLVGLCRRADGINPWTGTPENPIDPSRIPGGSSSGSAVAVARAEADVAYGTDTGGSVRVPAACCGVAGLKTSAGRISTHGVFELSRTLDTVGPLARDLSGLILGMRLLEPGFSVPERYDGPLVAGRLRPPGVLAPIDDAVDRALASSGVETHDVAVPEWQAWSDAANDIMWAEGWAAQRHLLDRADLLEERDIEDLHDGEHLCPKRIVACRRVRMAAQRWFAEALERYPVLALPTMCIEPPRLGEESDAPTTALTVPLNLAGLPAVSLPIPRRDGGFPASLQLVGRRYAEEELLAYARSVEPSTLT